MTEFVPIKFLYSASSGDIVTIHLSPERLRQVPKFSIAIERTYKWLEMIRVRAATFYFCLRYLGCRYLNRENNTFCVTFVIGKDD